MTFLLLFWEYFKIGLFTIGGGYAMLPLVTQVVTRNNWLTEAELVNFVAVSESTPGPFAINLATFVGTNVGSAELGILGGILGAFVATFGVVLPSLIIIIIVTRLFDKFKKSRWVQSALYGIRPVVVGLVLSALMTVLATVVLPNLNLKSITASGFDQFNWISLIIVLAFIPISNVKLKGRKLHPIFSIVLSAVVGIVIFRICGLTQ